MKLTEIKIAGFKSFVDPTTVLLPSNLIGIVGPNGCGKSNIIDAVRWVMGESSAKHLRGESMADVIFNGSNSRKPIAQASVELTFDNSDGTVGGQYASFSEISIKRIVTRDGTSNYYLNGAKCRKRDIVQVFLGTGLGPRSYSIIEQGMISRLIEAKPEELRVFLEEAAGISKYKERRKETENRIKHTRENLDRLNDLRDEVEKLLNKLQRQAKTAEKYKEYKQDERRLKAELLVIRLCELAKEIESEQSRVNEKENRLQENIAEQRSIEADIEKDRDAHHDATDVFNEVQGKYYGIGGDIARKEQAIQHSREMRKKQESDLEEISNNLKDLQIHIDQDEAKIQELKEKIEDVDPEFDGAKEVASNSKQSLSHAEQKMHDWQLEWDDFSTKASEPSEMAKVERIRIEQLERQTVHNEQRTERLQNEKSNISLHLNEEKISQAKQELDQSESLKSTLEQNYNDLLMRINERKEKNIQLSSELDEARELFQDVRAKLISLEALQHAALGETSEKSKAWIAECGLDRKPKLIDSISVESGWEKAVETVLGQNINAVCVDRIDEVTGLLHSLESGSISLLESSSSNLDSVSGSLANRLSEKVNGELSMQSQLGNVYAAEDLSQAMSLRNSLAAGESIITKQGIWLGPDWLRVIHNEENELTILERKERIDELKTELARLGDKGDSLKQEFESAKEYLFDDEAERDQVQTDFNKSHQKYSRLFAESESLVAQFEQTQNRLSEIKQEIEELENFSSQNREDVTEAKSRLEQALVDVERFDVERESLQSQRQQLRDNVDTARLKAESDSEQMHQLELEFQSNRGQLESTQENRQRMIGQTSSLTQRKSELDEQLATSSEPISEMEAELQIYLDQRIQVEAELNLARKKVDDFDTALRQHDLDRGHVEKKIQEVRNKLESIKMAWQEVRVRRKTIEEQFNETGYGEEELTEYLSEDANSKDWHNSVTELERKISNLGAINLAAIEEYDEQFERKTYLDTQYNDVSEALDTLENAIAKIDKETKEKFKDTFDKVNDGVKNMFPRLFGGGHAYLELTEDDLLNAGVTIMARPPGKRNSTIHLLSGGEKALTAVALVFSIFLLNPSPFCMLDEVDAPLDDANVARFCEMVKEMSEHVQFIFITHNKITMAISNHLSGVTMQEPGVSRMVAVDVEQAVKLAAV